MSKRLFVLLVVLMSLSLLGIIFVQSYWIKTTIEDKESIFGSTVNLALSTVSEKIERDEIRKHTDLLLQIKDSVGSLKDSNWSEILFVEKDELNDEVLVYSHGILKEDYTVPSSFIEGSEGGSDSATIRSYTSKRTKEIYRKFDLDGGYSSPVQRIEKIGGFTPVEKAQFDDVLREFVKLKPLHKRVSNTELDLLLQNEFKERGLSLDFEYGIFSHNLSTKVRSPDFEITEGAPYSVPILRNSEGETDFDLRVLFPKRNDFLVASIAKMATLSFVFTLVIVLAFSGAIYQLLRQKRISEIKSDFVNNMTHEFKTPIATINLALDAIKNPQAFGNPKKVKGYLQMIRDENKRMLAQVENVLRISKLEKKQLDINKDAQDAHDLIKEAVDHVKLIVENRGGSVKKHLNAERHTILASNMHFTNVLVNVLDNAIKYSPEPPEIDVETEDLKNYILIKVKDKGAGMSKAVLKKIFEKFYREPTGNIHNVKGHGLGLAYVKKIVEDHQGEVFAESEKNKGSTFYIKMPLI